MTLGPEDTSPAAVQVFCERIVRTAAPEIARCMVPLFGLQKQQLILNGTGTLFSIGSRFFVLSAAHVLDYPGIFKIPYYVPSADQGEPVLLKITKIVSSPLPKGADPLDIDMRDNDRFDIAIGELDSESAAKLTHYWRFARLMELDIATLARQAYHYVLGFPVSMTQSDPVARTSDVKALSYATGLYEGQRDSRDSSAELLLDYPEQNQDAAGLPTTVPHPRGISGCGIWRLLTPGKRMSDWSPDDVRLVGIEHRWRKVERYLVGTAIRHAMQLIYGRYDDLHPAMDLVYGKQRLFVSS
jgi:hypothetical protein